VSEALAGRADDGAGGGWRRSREDSIRWIWEGMAWGWFDERQVCAEAGRGVREMHRIGEGVKEG
jgi:hypothetical protein